MNKNLVEIIEKESMFEEERQNDIKWLEARFIVGQSYGVTDDNLKSNGVEIAFTVNKNTHKSLNITVYEKYNGVVTVTENVRKMLYPGSHGIWRKFEGVKYAGIECFDVSAKFSRWTKGTLFVFNTKEVNLDDFTSCDNVAKTESKEKSTKATTKLTIIQALTNFANRRGYEITRVRNDCEGAGLKVNVIIKNVKYYDYKHDSQYRGYSTIDGTYNAKSKTIDLIYKDIVVMNFSTADNNCTDKNQRHNIIVESAEQLYNVLNNRIKDFDIFFDNFDFDAEDAFSYFENPVKEVTEEQSKEDSEKSEPTPATEETTKEEHPETATKQEKHSKKSEPILKNVIDKSKLMRRAWDIRRNLAEEMKVEVSIISMSESLKMAWAEAKSTSNKEEFDYIKAIQIKTDKLNDYLMNLSEKQLRTIYTMLKMGGSAWAKNEKCRIYINNGFDLVETEKLELIKPSVWVGKNKFDWCKWNVNGFQTYDVFKHAKDDKAYCSQLAQGKIELDLYYDVLTGKFIYTDDSFKVAETVIEKIKATR